MKIIDKNKALIFELVNEFHQFQQDVWDLIGVGEGELTKRIEAVENQYICTVFTKHSKAVESILNKILNEFTDTWHRFDSIRSAITKIPNYIYTGEHGCLKKEIELQVDNLKINIEKLEQFIQRTYNGS